MSIRSDSAEEADFLIVGSGIAGLRAAIALAPAGRVVILTKADASESSTGYAQGGIAAAVADNDSPALHAADTIAAGDGLCDDAAVGVLTAEGPAYVRELVAWGATFDRAPDGQLALGLEAAHSVRRILHAGDSTGREIGRTLWRRTVALPSVRTVNHALVTELLLDADRAAVCGARYFDAAGAPRVLHARATLLATGGAGHVYRETTNPAVATGDGVALAFHAGARVSDLEFVQFHPTALNVPGAPRFLISEALRGEGARLVNSRGDAFMTGYHPAGDLAPRDVVARAIVRESAAIGGAVFLTLAHLDPEQVRRRFPTIAAMCAQVGLDLGVDRIPVGPAAHYLMGGIDTDVDGRTSLPGLFAAGETACTGVHGANRLASNSLLEGLVFGARAALAMMDGPRAAAFGADRVRGDAFAKAPRRSPMSELDLEGIRDVMWRSAGLFRTRAVLEEALDQLDANYRAAARTAPRPAPADWWRRFNLLTVARLITQAALRREESRGGHFREDFPVRDDLHWKVHVFDYGQ